MPDNKKPMKTQGGTKEVTLVSNGISCDGMEIITYFSGGVEIAKEILCDGGRRLSMTGTIPDGEVLEYHWVGTLHRVFNYANNRAHGMSRTYYPDGAIWMEQHYEKGSLDGPARTFYRSGSIREECTYKEGNLDGELKSYYEDGIMEAAAYYNQGSLEGDYKTYFPTGMPKESSTFRDGKREGYAATYHETGGFHHIDMCLAGKVIHRQEFDEDGRLLFEHSDPIAETEEERTNEAETHLSCGSGLATVGCSKETAEEFRRAISIDPSASEAYIRLALTYRRLGLFGDCINTLRTLLEIDPYHKHAHFNLAIIQIITGNRREAESAHRMLEGIDERYAQELRTILDSSVSNRQSPGG